MLPFLLRKRPETGVMVQERQPDNDEKSNDFDELEECAKDLKAAIDSGNARAIADAFHAMFQVCEESPHAEAEHINPHSYDASQED